MAVQSYYVILTGNDPYNYGRLSRYWASETFIPEEEGYPSADEMPAYQQKRTAVLMRLKAKEFNQVVITRHDLDLETFEITNTVIDAFRLPLKKRIEINKEAKPLEGLKKYKSYITPEPV